MDFKLGKVTNVEVSRLVPLLALAAGLGFATFLATPVRRDDRVEER